MTTISVSSDDTTPVHDNRNDKMSSLSMETNSVLTNNNSYNCTSSISVLFPKPKPDCMDEFCSDVCSSSTTVNMDSTPLKESFSVVMNKRPRLEDN